MLNAQCLAHLVLLLLSPICSRAATPDAPFLQDRSEKYPAEGELAGATMKKVLINKDGIVYVLTDRGMARLFGNKLALDHSFRPLNDKKILDATIAGGEIFYLLEDSLISNGFTGYAKKLPPNEFDAVIVRENPELPSPEFTLLLSGQAGGLLIGHAVYKPLTKENAAMAVEHYRKFGEQRTDRAISHWFPEKVVPQMTVKKDGWIGSQNGVWRDSQREFYASRRWLLDDYVVDIAGDDNDENPYVLTKTGLNRIIYAPTSLEAKAFHYENKIRQRHIRFGFCSELRLSRPGDPTSAEMIDTDNDGTWSEYYLASQAFRYGATRDPKARENAWETFAAMERLESINSLGGFPARTFERKGYKVSDPDRWRDRGDGLWEWKGHTSSDEIIAHMFGCSVLYECVAQTKQEKDRIAAFVTKIADHILRNNYYLIDVDGKPTLWGRWNPDYVNWFPHSIVDRRLNSAEIIALLQFAYAISGDARYKANAMELIEKHGYLENILWPMKDVALTKGFIHQGNDMGDEWNHSDDLLSFDAYWVLYRYAFNNDLKKKYAAAIRDHWQIEKEEKNPIFNFVYASTGAKDADIDGALWTLRRFPLDMVDWDVHNSHRQDITKLPPNFRGRELVELLPPGERRVTRWNGHPFVLDGGSGGHTELAGDEYLLPYWMGRYLKIIGPPIKESKTPPALP